MGDNPTDPERTYSVHRRRLLQAGLATGAGLFAATGAQPVAADDDDDDDDSTWIDAQPIDPRPLNGEDPEWSIYRTAEDLATDTDMRALKCGLYDDRVKRSFITYMGEGDAPAYVQAYQHANAGWTPPIKVGESFDDSHNYPTMVQDNDGLLHVFHGCHNSPLRHATPDDVRTVRSEWTDEAIEEAGGASYPMPFVTDNGDIFCLYRETYVIGDYPGDEGYDTAYRPMRYVRSTDGGETWSNSVELTGHEGAVNDGRRDNWINEIYAEQLKHESAANGNPERLHFTWMISGGLNEDGDHSHGEYLQNVYYAYFTPEDLHWHTADGTDLGQSITPEEMDTQCIVENTLDDDDFTLKHSVPFDKWVHVTEDGRPVLLYCLRAPDDMEPGGNFGRLALWNGSEWEKSDLADFTYPQYGLERIGSETYRYYSGGGYSLDIYEVDASEAGADGQIGEKVDEIPFPADVTADGGMLENYRDPVRLTAPQGDKPADVYVAGKPSDNQRTRPGPDLTIANREFAVEPIDDETYEVTIPVANVGDSSAPETTAAVVDVTDEEDRIGTVDVPALDVNESEFLTYTWDVSDVPAGTYEIQGVVDPDDEVNESNETNNATSTVSVNVIKPPTGDTYLSDHPWVDATIGWGEIGLDESVVDNPIRIGGNEYEKGIGTHAESTITYYLAGNMSRFVADVGVNDETGDDGSVRFHVVGDGETLAETDVLYGSDDEPVSLDVDVTGVEMLDLVVTDGNGSINSDHADWAIAQVLE